MAETIVFGGQKLDIDPNDELWKQLAEKYSQKNQTGWEEPNVYEPPKPLTYEDLEALLESDEYEEIGICVYVQELPYSFVTIAVLDRFIGEILAVCGEGLSFRGRDYGKTWVAYRTPPVFDNE